ncbi:MAG TPA: chemotaxis protein CheX [Sediminispirochaeta sp.]|nr:chemotaxis protein CheX [Sediminispirochaeta sp.]
MVEINEHKARQALIKASKDTLGEMAFLDVMELEEAADFKVGQQLFIEFSHPIRGRMLLSFPLEIKQAIVENIHATDWESLSFDEIDDCLLELLNILAGNFLRELHEESVKVQLSFPRVLFSLDEIGDIENFYVYYFDAEGSPFSVSLSLKEEE